MQAVIKERWIELCKEAAKEQDSARLLELVREINSLMAERSCPLEARDRDDGN